VKVIWTKKSLDAMDAIYEYVSNDNQILAKKIIARIFATVEITINNFPHIGRTGSNFRTREYVMSEYPYVIIYSVKNSCLHILKIIHTSMKYP
jgi:toxin ParE1/3/4